MNSLKLLLAYDGTPFLGWQKTKEGPSVQETLEKALFRIARCEVKVEAASRTDRGVHAHGQVVQCSLPDWDLCKLHYSLNAVLPKEIRVLEISSAREDFHPTLDALSKEYRYYLDLGPFASPKRRLYAWHLHPPLDLAAMQESLPLFIGKKDFAAFTTKFYEDTMRTLFDLQIARISQDMVEIQLIGDRFLYKMARRLVGTLVMVGKRVFSKEDVLSLFTTPDRKKAGMTAPAKGLFLHEVVYE